MLMAVEPIIPRNIDPFYSAPTSPERVLLCAVLERAFRDLNLPRIGEYDQEDAQRFRREAVSWFYTKPSTTPIRPRGFSFQQIKEELELTAGEVELIMLKVRLADEFATACEIDKGEAFKAYAQELMNRQVSYSTIRRRGYLL